MIGHQCQHVLFLGKNVVGKAAQGAFWADLNKGTHPVGIERFQPFNPLHRGGDLLLQNILDGFNFGGVKVTGHVGHQWQSGRRNPQPV